MATSSSRDNTSSRARFWPHHQVAMCGIFRSSPKKRRLRLGRKPSSARASITPDPGILATTTPFFRSTSIRPGTPSCEEASSSKRIEKIGIDPAQQHVEPLQAGDGADMDAVAADGEIVAFDQQESEVARQRGVLEIGFAELAGRQQPDSRLVAIGAGAQGIAERLEEWRDTLHIHRFVERRKRARQHETVFQCVARARRRLRPVAQHPPPPIGSAADICGIQAEVSAAGRLDPANRAQIFGAAGNRRRRDRALGNQSAFAVEIAQNQFQQFGALHDAGGQLPPFGVVDQQRQMTERPDPVGGFAGRAIADPGLPQVAVGRSEAPFDFT